MYIFVPIVDGKLSGPIKKSSSFNAIAGKAAAWIAENGYAHPESAKEELIQDSNWISNQGEAVVTIVKI